MVQQVYGGFAQLDATGNEVTIEGWGNVKMSVLGGFSNMGNATGNTINLSAQLPGVSVWGGQCRNSGCEQKKDNTLVVTTTHAEADRFENFDAIKFNLHDRFGSNPSAVALTTNTPVDLDGVTITVSDPPTLEGELAGSTPMLINRVTNTPTKVEGLPSGHTWEIKSSGGVYSGLIIKGKPYPLTLVATPTEGGEVTCSRDVWHGDSTTCTAKAKPGYAYKEDSIRLTSGAATVSCRSADCTLSNVTRAPTVEAAFTRLDSTHKITAEPSPLNGGSVTCTPSTVEHGKDVTITCTAAPESGRVLRDLWLEGTSCGSTTTCTATAVTHDLVVKALFSPAPIYAITATSSGNGTIDCSPTEAEEGKGVTITCTPSPDAGYALGSLSLPGGTCSGTTCSVANVTGTLNVSAVFTPFTGTHAITTEVIPAEGGSVDCDATSVASGGSVTCTATANEGYTYDDDSIRLASGSASVNCGSNTCTLTDVASALSVKATFTKNGGGNTG
ncbi:MAG: hypothetical protein IJM64_02120, partial [Ottowia sp.]|nr:hypothetical protein [Ottowia sp.]